jgi:hypothetical protein
MRTPDQHAHELHERQGSGGARSAPEDIGPGDERRGRVLRRAHRAVQHEPANRILVADAEVSLVERI